MIHVLCYKSMENEVFRFFLENEHLAPHLHIYTLQPLESLSGSFQEMISYFISLGSQYASFGHMSPNVYRSEYIRYLKVIFQDIDLVICCYNGDKPSSVIPADVAKECGIDAFICDLPKENEILAQQSFESKLRLL